MPEVEGLSILILTRFHLRYLEYILPLWTRSTPKHLQRTRNGILPMDHYSGRRFYKNVSKNLGIIRVRGTTRNIESTSISSFLLLRSFSRLWIRFDYNRFRNMECTNPPSGWRTPIHQNPRGGWSLHDGHNEPEVETGVWTFCPCYSEKGSLPNNTLN